MLILELFNPTDEINEQMSDIISAREFIGHALNNPDKKHDYFNFLKHLRDKHGADYSTLIHKEAGKLAKHKEKD